MHQTIAEKASSDKGPAAVNIPPTQLNCTMGLRARRHGILDGLGGPSYGFRRILAAEVLTYIALLNGRMAGLLPAATCNSRCQFRGEPGVNRPSNRGTSAPVIAVWLAGT